MPQNGSLTEPGSSIGLDRGDIAPLESANSAHHCLKGEGPAFFEPKARSSLQFSEGSLPQGGRHFDLLGSLRRGPVTGIREYSDRSGRYDDVMRIEVRVC